MSNTIINWRFWAYHLQVIRWSDWPAYLRDGRSPITWARNNFHARGGAARASLLWKRVEFYEGGRYLSIPSLLIALLILLPL